MWSYTFPFGWSQGNKVAQMPVKELSWNKSYIFLCSNKFFSKLNVGGGIKEDWRKQTCLKQGLHHSNKLFIYTCSSNFWIGGYSMIAILQDTTIKSDSLYNLALLICVQLCSILYLYLSKEVFYANSKSIWGKTMWSIKLVKRLSLVRRKFYQKFRTGYF